MSENDYEGDGRPAIDESSDVHDFPQQSTPVDPVDVITPEDEAKINALLGDASPLALFGASQSPSREKVEEMARLRMEAENYNVIYGAEIAEDALNCLAEQFNQSYDALIRHLTLEWNHAIIHQDANMVAAQGIEDASPDLPADDLQRLNPVRFTEYGRSHIDQGIALLRESLRR